MIFETFLFRKLIPGSGLRTNFGLTGALGIFLLFADLALEGAVEEDFLPFGGLFFELGEGPSLREVGMREAGGSKTGEKWSPASRMQPWEEPAIKEAAWLAVSGKFDSKYWISTSCSLLEPELRLDLVGI